MEDKKKLVEKYADNRTIRSIVNLVPYLGGALDVLISETGGKYRNERLEKLLGDLDSKISNSENPEILIKKLSESEEFYDLLIQSLNSAIKSRHDEKLICYSNILFNNLRFENDTSEISSELFVSILDGLTIQELHYLSEIKRLQNQVEFHIICGEMVFWDKYKAIIEQTGIKASQASELPIESVFQYKLDIIWKLLTDKNLIEVQSRKVSSQLSYSHKTSNTETNGGVDFSDKLVIRITDFGLDFVNWVLESKSEN